MGQSKQNGDWKHRGIRSQYGDEHLKAISAEQQFLACGAKQQHDGNKDQAS